MTKTFGLALFGAVAFLAGTPAAAADADFSGRWATAEFGELSVDQSGRQISGTYTHQDGRVVGKVDDNAMFGLWAQSNSGRRCSRTELGTFYWGRFKVLMSGDAERWSGGWSYCDEPEATGGGWNGKRIGESPHSGGQHDGGGYADGPAAPTTFEGRWETKEFGETRLEERDGHVRGSYAWKGGQIRGDIDGNRLEGTWAQIESGRRCGREKMGSFYWGRFAFQLSSDSARWTGTWSYCEDAEGSGGAWNGRRIGE